jgi:DNA polymerase-3 subunit alpha
VIKFDFLGIDTISIIKEATNLIRARGITIDPYKVPDGDTKTYKMIANGILGGIFQMETSGSAKTLATKIKPTCIQEMSDLSALNRPGPMQGGLDKMYIENKENGYPPEGMPERLARILSKTYWTIIYQEQVMQICSEIAGFTLKEADDVRRAMGKKKKEELDHYELQFTKGCQTTSNMSENTAKELWDTLVGFGDYGFNKSHSVN